MKAIHLIDITPEELQNMISEGVKTCLENSPQTTKNILNFDYLTREETANLLKINLSTLYSWTKKNKLVSYGIEGRVYYKRSEVEQALVKLN